MWPKQQDCELLGEKRAEKLKQDISEKALDSYKTILSCSTNTSDNNTYGC